MYTQFFGNYLLSRSIINPEQLLDVFQAQSAARVKIGALAIDAGYMTASEVEQILIIQTHVDKRFGQIAVEEGYLTQEQLETLLEKQAPGFMLLGQILIDKKILTHTRLEELIIDYKSEYEICDLDMALEQKEMVEYLLKNLHESNGIEHIDYISSYLILLFNNLIRFIGEDFTPLDVINLTEIPTNYCTTQAMENKGFGLSTGFDVEPEVFINFASRYAGETFDEYDEYVQASIEDFLNLQNGLFIMNMSNNYSLETFLHPPVTKNQDILSYGKESYLLPIMYPFGTIYFIWSFSEKTS